MKIGETRGINIQAHKETFGTTNEANNTSENIEKSPRLLEIPCYFFHLFR